MDIRELRTLRSIVQLTMRRGSACVVWSHASVAALECWNAGLPWKFSASLIAIRRRLMMLFQLSPLPSKVHVLGLI
jgi:hypothetical protein